MLTFINAEKVKIIASEEMAWSLDGEHEPGHGCIEAVCLHKAMRVYTGYAEED